MTVVPPATALAELRARRSSRRTEGIDPFDAFYQAYVTALIAGMGLLLASSFIGDQPITATNGAIVHDGARWLGLLTAIAAATGLRSGSRGGPLAIEAPDVQHVLLAPVDTRRALWAPALRQLRFLVAASAAAGAAGGQLATHRLPGNAIAWMAAGALWAVATVVLAIGLAWLAAGTRLRPWLATTIAAALVGTSIWDVVSTGAATAPTTAFGRLGVLPLGFHPVALAAPVAALAAAVVGGRLLGGISIELLRRRSSLVGELRFAATMRDLRTVMLLRRQLNQEQPRHRPWIRTRRRGGRTIVVLRDWRALVRTPATRILRLAGLALAATAAGVGVWRGTTALIVAAGLCTFLAGLEALEPLAQEVDHCTFLDLAPVVRGPQMVQHLVVPAAVMIITGFAGAGAIAVVGHGSIGVGVAAVTAIPAALAGTMGAAISVLRDAEPQDSGDLAQESMMIPPEAVGMRLLYRTAWPPAVAMAGFLPVLMARRALDTGLDPIGGATSAAFLVLMLSAGVAAWVRYRDELHAWWSTASAQATKR